MKKRIFALLLALTLLLTGCELGQVVEGVRPSNGGTVPPSTGPSGEVDENPFTVSLMYQGEPFRTSTPITVQWSSLSEVHTSQTDDQGVAKVSGLDGDYRVTLLNLPDGFYYNPNVYRADNFERNIVIDLMSVIKPSGQGYSLDSPIGIDKTGVYYIEVAGPTDERYFRFTPKESGTFAVESWMDVTANDVNPLCNYYGASFAFPVLKFTQDGGGAESTYTKNFLLTVDMADENISKNDTGSVVFTFGIFASMKNEWPTDAQGKYQKLRIYFAITRNGNFELEHAAGTIVSPKEDLDEIYGLDENGWKIDGRVDMEPGGAWHWAEDPLGAVMVFDAEHYKLWPVDEGGDGVYHRWDDQKYREVDADGNVVNPGYGPVLFAMVSGATRFLTDRGGQPIGLTQVEYQGNKALTVANGELNYKMFIEGWWQLNWTDYDKPGDEDGMKPPYFCDLLCPCRVDETCTSAQMGLDNGTCEIGCTKCSSLCRQLEREDIGTIGYGQRCNSDGAFPVTEELKEFLQLMSISQLYFMDGQGWVETGSGIYATEADQWLWACGYYE